MRIRSAAWAVVAIACCHQVSSAHPGHAVDAGSSNSLIHYLTHPDHLAQWLIAGIGISVAVLIARSIKRLAPAYARARKKV